MEGMHTTDDMPAMQMNTIRTKKLKTNRDETATNIRNRSKTRTRNMNNKGTQLKLPSTIKYAYTLRIA